MKTRKEVREYLRKAREKITRGTWGLYGLWQNGMPPQPHKAELEAAPSISIGSTGEMEAVARFNGYKHDCMSNANYITILVNHIEDMLDDLDELEEENQILRDLIRRMKEGKNVSS